MEEHIEKELLANRIKGPYLSSPFSKFQISPIGLVPKKEPNSYRMITHLSCPDGTSINDGISKDFATVMYASVDDAIKAILKVGKGAFLAKADIKSAFRLIPVSPDQYHLLCMKWKGKYYYDCCLPMGVKSACQIFEVFSSNIEHILKSEGVLFVLHYLDDYLFVNGTLCTCDNDLNSFEKLADDINLPLATEKTIRPTQKLEFLGLEIDTIAEIVRLPIDKVEKCKSMIGDMLSRSKCQLKELQALLGLLNFACAVVAPGRAFLQSMYSLTSGLTKKNHYKRLTVQVKKDLKVFYQFLDSYNGVSFYREQMFMSCEVKHLHTDAAQGLGYGAVFVNEWFSIPWPSQFWKVQNITLLELIPIVLALATWGKILSNQVLIIHTDNDALHFVINKQYSKEDDVKHWIRQLVTLSLKFNILLKAKHILGKQNILADALSRLDVKKFLKLHPTASRKASIPPPIDSFLSD